MLTSGAAETLIATAKQVAETLRVKLDLPLVRKWGSNGEEIRFVGRKVVVSVDPEFGAETTLVIDWTPGEPVRPEKPKKDPWEPLFKQVLLNTIGRAGSDQRPYSDGPVVRAVDIDVVRMDYYRHVLEDSPGTKQDTRRKAFARAMEKARKGPVLRDRRATVCLGDRSGHGTRTRTPDRPLVMRMGRQPGQTGHCSIANVRSVRLRDRTRPDKCPGCPAVRVAKMHGSGGTRQTPSSC